MNDHRFHIVFAGGATGGHLFPGLAVARWIAAVDPQVRITFAGSGRDFERRHVAAAGFEYLALACRPMPRRWQELIPFFAENAAGYRQARRWLNSRRVDAVVGLGGYVSVPVARAAAACGLPLVLLEQNAVPGRATRWLARWATIVCVAMAQTRSRLRCRCPVRVTGTPIRQSQPELRSLPARKRLIVLGGSAGARALNENVPRALYKAGSQLVNGWEILHQAGAVDVYRTRVLYGKLGLTAAVEAFFDDVPRLLEGTGLAVCRSGGTTLAELASAGVPAVLLPYPHAADDHQRHNAEALAGAGAAIMLDARCLSGRLDDHLSDVLKNLFTDAPKRARMSAVMRRLSHPDAAEEVAELVLELLGGRAGRVARAAAA